MKRKEVKGAVEDAFRDAFKGLLESNPNFASDPTEGVFNWISSQGVDKFYHPSLVVCVERAPLTQEDLLLYEIPLELFLTTLAISDSFEVLHDNRLRAIQEAIGEDGSTIINKIQSVDPRITILRIEAGESETFTDNLHWVDKQSFTVYLQF